MDTEKKTKILSPRVERRKKWFKEKRERDKARVTRARTSDTSSQKKSPVRDTTIVSDRGFKSKFTVPHNNNNSKSKQDKNKKSKDNLKRKRPEKEDSANVTKNSVKTNPGNKTPTKQEAENKDKQAKSTPKKAKLEIVDAVEKLENSTSIHIPKRYVLFVGNLPDDITKEQVEEHFRKTGGVKSVRIPLDKNTSQPKGFAYVEFNSNISHRIALRLHNTTLCGRKIVVEFTSNGKVTKKQLESIKERDENKGALVPLKMPFDT